MTAGTLPKASMACKLLETGDIEYMLRAAYSAAAAAAAIARQYSKL